jgi:SSS family solute:Na+ symporter
VQRAFAAKDLNAARLTPIIGAFPKIFIPLVTIIPSMAAILIFPGLGQEGNALTYNDAIPALMERYLPTGVLGVAVTGLVAAFMAGMAANVSAFNAVFTYDIWQDHLRPERPDRYYLTVGRWVTVIGIVIGIGTAFFAAGFSNISNYFQVLFGFLNVPLFTAFIIGMFWRRASASAGFWGILVGTLASISVYLLYKGGMLGFRSDLHESLWGAIVAFAAGALAMAIASSREPRKSDDELRGLVKGLEVRDPSDAGRPPWYKSPLVLGLLVLVMAVSLYLVVAPL